MKFVVIGGTGLIGSKVVSGLRAAGHEVVVGAPSSGIDILTGAGLDQAMQDTDTVIDLSNSPSFEDQAVMDFFQTGTRNLLAAGAKAGVRHHLALSVVGTQRLTKSGYFRAKIAQEEQIRASGMPYSIVHSTQFFEFLPGIIKNATEGNGVHLPPALIQPIAADNVADAVIRYAAGKPVRAIAEISGPERDSMPNLARRFLDAVGDPRQVVPDPEALYFGAPLQMDSLLPGAGAWQGDIGFQQWLDGSGRTHFQTQA
jgi:uncharacterized protein YbjT (DUF2867 family)